MEGNGGIGDPGMESPSWAHQAVNHPYGAKPVPKVKPKRQAALAAAAKKRAVAVATTQRNRMKAAYKNRAKPLGGDHYGGAL